MHFTRLYPALLAALTVASCGPAPFPREVLVPRHSLISPGPTADSVVVAVFDAVDPSHAPRPQNESEELVFGHLYETLVGTPGLAEFPESDNSRKTYTFVIRAGARFWDGTPVTAGDVLASWQAPEVQRVLVDSGVDSVVAADSRTLRVHTAREDWFGRMLENPVFSVAKPRPGGGWPLGSGPYEVTRAKQSARHVVIRVAGGGRPAICFLPVDRQRARDVLQGNVDVMVTGDRDVIEYAAASDRFDTVALDWDLTYVILAPARALAVRDGDSLTPLPLDLTMRLARDVVPVDAMNLTETPTSPGALRGCGDSFFEMPWLPPEPAIDPARRIVYDEGDPVARSLAERIAALAALDPNSSPDAAAIIAAIPGITDGPVTAEGVAAAALAPGLRRGLDLAYVCARRYPVDRCRNARELIESARWLIGLHYDLDQVCLPLIVTRRHAIVARGRVTMYSDRGTPRIVSGFEAP